MRHPFLRRATLAAALLSGGCYHWSDHPADSLRALQPEGLRRAASPSISPDDNPPSRVEILLTSGETIQLEEPFAIGEASPGEFRVTDGHSPVRTVSLAEITRVRTERRNATLVGTAVMALPVVVGCVVMLSVLSGAGSARSTTD